MNVTGLIVGLGNPGREYERTRHNLGFMAVDAFLAHCERTDARSCDMLSGGKKKYDLWRCRIHDQQWLVTKPQTFMNLSGEAVLAIASYYRVKPDSVLVVHDELDIALGRMKFKTGGGNAGHNGLKSITQLLGTPDFHRLRLGIGKPQGQRDTSGWVLGHFAAEEQKLVDVVLPAAVQGILTFITKGAQATTQFVNAYQP